MIRFGLSIVRTLKLHPADLQISPMLHVGGGGIKSSLDGKLRQETRNFGMQFLESCVFGVLHIEQIAVQFDQLLTEFLRHGTCCEWTLRCERGLRQGHCLIR